MSKIYRKRKLPSYEVIIKQTPFFFMDENGKEHFDSEDEVVQELVRCRDCKWWDVDSDGIFCEYGRVPKDNWFCADGERREE